MSGTDDSHKPPRKRAGRPGTDQMLAIGASVAEELLDGLEDGPDLSDDELSASLDALQAELEADDEDDAAEPQAEPTPMDPAEPQGEPASAVAAQDEVYRSWGDIVWAQLHADHSARWALWGLAAIALLAVYAPLLASSRPLLWDDGSGLQSPWLRSLFDRNYFENPVDIFFNVLMIFGTPLTLGLWLRARSRRRTGGPRRAAHRALQREAAAVVGLLMLITAGLLAAPSSHPYASYEADGEGVTRAVFAPLPYSAQQTGFEPLAGPGVSRGQLHPLGVDSSSRDVAVRLLFGARISLSIGVLAVGLYVLIGMLLGALAGFFGGRTDLIIQRVIEIMMAMPVFFLVLTMVAFFDRPSIFHIMIVIGIFGWTRVARLVRGEFLRLRNEDFVVAARALGYPPRQIMFKHIMPNALGPVLVAATFGVAAAILIESSLSFLGLGDVSAPSWGQTLADGYATGAWHLILAPSAAIFCTVFVLNLVGEGLRDALDPRLRG